MAKQAEAPLFSLDNQSFSIKGFLDFLRRKGKNQLLHDFATEKLIQEESSKRGISFSEEELQQASDSRRLELELDEASQFTEFLRSSHLTLEDWELDLRINLLGTKLKALVVPEEKIEQNFYEHKLDYDQASLSRIVVEEEGLAQEIAVSTREKETTFEDMARRHTTIVEERFSGGFQGLLARPELPEELENVVFNAKAGSVVGPVPVDELYYILFVHEIKPAQLTAEIKEAIRSQLFAWWLEEALKTCEFKILI